MSGALFYLPNARQLSSGGSILPGWKVKFFLSGTLTPTPVYADGGLTTPLGTSVAASMDGHMPPIYLDPTIRYRAQIYDANDVLQPDGDIDPIDVSRSLATAVPLISQLTDIVLRYAYVDTSAAAFAHLNIASLQLAQITSSFPALTPGVSLLSGTNRFLLNSGAVANSSAGVMDASTSRTFFHRMSGSAVGGGYRLGFVFGVPSAALGVRFFCGVSPYNSDPVLGSNPSAKLNVFGLGCDTGDVNIQAMQNDGSGTATKTDTGISFASIANKLIKVTIDATPTGGTWTLRVCDSQTDYSGSFLSTDLPAADTALNSYCGINTGAGTSVVTFAFSSLTEMPKFAP